jgi:transposase
MPKQRKRPALSEEEKNMLEKWSRSRKGERRLVERSQMVLWAAEGMSGPEIGRRLGRDVDTVYRVLNRFEGERLAGLRDQARSGRPAEYDEIERGRLVAAARTNPQQVGRPFGSWTLDRLVEYVNQEVGIPISRAQLARLLQAEGLRWYQEKVYFSERPDPQFAEKRGR